MNRTILSLVLSFAPFLWGQKGVSTAPSAISSTGQTRTSSSDKSPHPGAKKYFCKGLCRQQERPHRLFEKSSLTVGQTRQTSFGF